MHSGAVVLLYVHTCLEAKFIVIVLKVCGLQVNLILKILMNLF